MLKTCEHCCEHALYYLWLVPTTSIFQPPKFFVPAFICLCSFARKEARKGVEKSLEVCLVWSWMNLRNWDASFQLGSKRALRNKRHTCQTYLDVGLIKEGLELSLKMQQSKNPNDYLKIIPIYIYFEVLVECVALLKVHATSVLLWPFAQNNKTIAAQPTGWVSWRIFSCRNRWCLLIYGIVYCDMYSIHFIWWTLRCQLGREESLLAATDSMLIFAC